MSLHVINPHLQHDSTTDVRLSFLALKRLLVRLGLGGWALRKPEVSLLHKTLGSCELVKAVCAGRSDAGWVMLVATDRRILYLDAKPLFSKVETIGYDVVSGVTLEWVAWSGVMVLHTRIRDFRIHTHRQWSAQLFRDYVSRYCIERLPLLTAA